ncbi:MAG: Lrp/AsnC family transcriptional regulator [Gaiellaceae bacterium]
MNTDPHDRPQKSLSIPLDRTERAILAVLQQNARISNRALSEYVGIAASTCLERVRRLRTRGVIRGFHADVDPSTIGRPIQALIAVRLRAHSREPIDAFYRHITELPEALAVYHVAGADDYLIHVAVEDTTTLRDLVVDDFTARPEVDHVETRLVFEFMRKHAIEPV